MDFFPWVFYLAFIKVKDNDFIYFIDVEENHFSSKRKKKKKKENFSSL